ncbi:MAG: aldehyde dehydrogenase family protein, partial [Verrucomicrobiota bacterium]|nr:aldehyde dehydrogenase family protein [Verrucomicrobiota bacterium]
MADDTLLETPEVEISPKAQAFLDKQKKCLINGKWIDSATGEAFSVYNPANGEVIDMASSGDKEDIDAAVKAARSVFDNPQHSWNTMTPSERGKLIWKIGDLILE